MNIEGNDPFEYPDSKNKLYDLKINNSSRIKTLRAGRPKPVCEYIIIYLPSEVLHLP
jgi:hypothetical protein